MPVGKGKENCRREAGEAGRLMGKLLRAPRHQELSASPCVRSAAGLAWVLIAGTARPGVLSIGRHSTQEC